MSNSRLGKIVRSVFVRLLVVIFLTGLFIQFMVGGFFFAYSGMVSRPFQKNIVQYLNYLIADMGSPPSPERAKELAEQSSLQIHFESADSKWSTSDNFSKFKTKRLRPLPEYPNIHYSKYHGRPLFQVDHKNGRYLFKLALRQHPDPEHRRPFIALLLALAILLLGAFFLIRRILRPVKWLNVGVQEVGKGNLKHRVPEKGSDELKDLAKAFNDMTGRIGDMLQAKEQLLLDVSHELRSPITRMKVALEFLPDSQAKTSISADTSEMEKMITGILEGARMHHLHGRLNRQTVNLVELLEQILPGYANQPPGVRAEQLPSTAECFVDPEQVKTALKNILSNALKYSDSAGEPVVVTVKRQPPYIVVQVTDKGIGIPEEELPYIFEPFYRVDKSRSKETGGFGLGLSLCKTILEAHGGKIELESKPGQGTTVSLFFPVTVRE